MHFLIFQVVVGFVIAIEVEPEGLIRAWQAVEELPGSSRGYQRVFLPMDEQGGEGYFLWMGFNLLDHPQRLRPPTGRA